MALCDSARARLRRARPGASARERYVSAVARIGAFEQRRARPATSLLIHDGMPQNPFILMGRRHSGHVFMPGALVFPGGRVEPEDFRIPARGALTPDTVAKLVSRTHTRTSGAVARALALAGIRETFEETGVMIGEPARAPAAPRPDIGQVWMKFLSHQVNPALHGFSYIARAITPHKRSRRFDTRFFAVPASRVAHVLQHGDGELEAVGWFSLQELRRAQLHIITRAVLEDFSTRLAEGRLADPRAGVPLYSAKGARFQRAEI